MLVKKNWFIFSILLTLLVALPLNSYLRNWWPFEKKWPELTTASASHLATKECPYTFVSWNIANFGRSRTDDDIELMAKILRHADIIAIQEVTAGKNFGIQAVARLADALKRTGDQSWDYIVSDPTEPASPGVERYAFLFRGSKVAMNRKDATLTAELRDAIDREPYSSLFAPRGISPLSVFTIHTVPAPKNPLKEVRALAESKAVRTAERAIVAGDFNLGPKDTDGPFNASGYDGHIRERTSLKRKMNHGEYLVHQYDNIYTKNVAVCTAGVIDFVVDHFSPITSDSLGAALTISDHVPVYATFR